MAVYNEGFFAYKKDKKALSFYPKPCDLEDQNPIDSLYESQEYLKRVQVEYDSNQGMYFFNIADEMRYLKRYKLDSTKRKRELVQTDEYFVSKTFDGSKNFLLSNEMVYEDGINAHLCQNRGEETEDSESTIDPKIFGIVTSSVTDEYPLESQRWLLIYGPLDGDTIEEEEEEEDVEAEGEDDSEDYGFDDEGLTSDEFHGYGAILIPQYNQPKVQILAPNDVSYYKAEYFYFHDNNYIVYHRQSYNHSDHVKIDIYRRNGDVYQNMKLKLEGCYDHNDAKIIISPSGKYMFYVEADDKDSQIAWGRVVELKLDPETKEFYTNIVDNIDFKKRYEKTASDFNSYQNYSLFEIFITDAADLIWIQKNENIIKFNDKEVPKRDFVKKFGKDPFDATKDRTLNDVNVIPKNGGVALFTEDNCWFMRYDTEKKKIYKMERLNFNINKGQMTIQQI